MYEFLYNNKYDLSLSFYQELKGITLENKQLQWFSNNKRLITVNKPVWQLRDMMLYSDRNIQIITCQYKDRDRDKRRKLVLHINATSYILTNSNQFNYEYFSNFKVIEIYSIDNIINNKFLISVNQ